jgi:UTP-glucose-1-phosphate uridylyltransferase
MQHSALVRRLRNELLAAARIAAMRMEAEAMSGRSQFDVGFEAGYARALAQFAANRGQKRRELQGKARTGG